MKTDPRIQILGSEKVIFYKMAILTFAEELF